MQYTNYQFVYIPKWEILNHENYYFTTLNKLYNKKTNRIIKKVVKGGLSVGYVIDGEFITLKKLKPLLQKISFSSKNNLSVI